MTYLLTKTLTETKHRQKNYNKGSKDLPKVKRRKSASFEHQKGQPWTQGLFVQNNDRNYVVKNTDGILYKRNRSQLRPAERETILRDSSSPSISDSPEPNVDEKKISMTFISYLVLHFNTISIYFIG